MSFSCNANTAVEIYTLFTPCKNKKPSKSNDKEGLKVARPGIEPGTS